MHTYTACAHQQQQQQQLCQVTSIKCFEWRAHEKPLASLRAHTNLIASGGDGVEVEDAHLSTHRGRRRMKNYIYIFIYSPFVSSQRRWITITSSAHTQTGNSARARARNLFSMRCAHTDYTAAAAAKRMILRATWLASDNCWPFQVQLAISCSLVSVRSQ